MTQPHPAITMSYTHEVATCATARDGQHAATVLRLTTVLRFPPLDPWEPAAHAERTAAHTDQSERFTEWLDTYIEGHDLTGTLDFAPTGPNLAVYLARVVRQVAPAACSLTVTDGAYTYTVVVDRDA